jgi:hypothetical protein
LEIRRQRPDFLNLGGRPDQKILILLIKPAKRANNIADVCADAKLGHPSDVDGDLH